MRKIVALLLLLGFVVPAWAAGEGGKTERGLAAVYAQKLGIIPPIFKVKCQSKRWGSCTAKNLLNFNVKIVMAPPSQVKYVAAHEVCHVKIKDHSLRYWTLLESIMPDSGAAKQALKIDGWKYEF